MSVTITYPRYSFVRSGTDYGSCYSDTDLCLPISSVNNLKFQLTIASGEFGLSIDLTAGDTFITPVPMDYDCSDHTLPSIGVLSMAHMVHASIPTTDFHGGLTFTALADFDIADIEFDTVAEDGIYWYPAVGECFKFAIVNFKTGNSTLRILGCLGCFKRIDVDTCYTSVLTYSNNEDAFDFIYQRSPSPNFVNRVELPIYLRDPTMNDDQKVYTKSDGSIVKLYERKEEVYALETDRLPYTWLKALDVALSHDTISIVCPNTQAFDSVNTATDFVKNGNFEIAYDGSKSGLSAFGKGTCKLSNSTPVHLFNNNCS